MRATTSCAVFVSAEPNQQAEEEDLQPIAGWQLANHPWQKLLMYLR